MLVGAAPPGFAVPGAGVAGQVIAKTSNTDGAVGWAASPSAGGAPVYVSGQWYTNATCAQPAPSSVSPAQSTTYWMPFYAYQALTVNGLGVTTASTVTVTGTLAAATCTAAGTPGALLATVAVNAESADATLTLLPVTVASFVMPAGWNYLGIYLSGTLMRLGYGPFWRTPYGVYPSGPVAAPSSVPAGLSAAGGPVANQSANPNASYCPSVWLRIA